MVINLAAYAGSAPKITPRIANKMRRFGTFPSQESGRDATVQVLLFRQQRESRIPGEDILRFGESVLNFRGIDA